MEDENQIDIEEQINQNVNGKKRGRTVSNRFIGDRNLEWQDPNELDLPDGVRAFLEQNGVPSDAPYKTYVYRVVSEPGKKDRRLFCFATENEIPEEPEVQERCGQGEYVRMLHWYNKAGEKIGMETKRLFIDDTGPVMVAPTGHLGQAGRGGNVPASDPVLSQDDNFDKELKRFKMLKEIFSPSEGSKTTPDQLAQFVERVSEASIKQSMKAIEQISEMGREMSQRIFSRQMDTVDPPAPEKEESMIPDWLQPLIDTYLPKLKKHADRLVASTPKGAAAREMLLEDEDFQEIWKDTDRRVQAYEVIAEKISPAFAKGLFNQLLNEQAEMEKAQAEKPKA